MSHACYSEIHLHIVWHTKDSLPLLMPSVEPLVHRFLRQKIMNMPGVFVHAIGGTETHVHLVVTVPPTLLISDFIGQIKGASSHEANQQSVSRETVLQWQNGYGVVSFGTKNLEWITQYVRNQRLHHAAADTHDRLERTHSVTSPG